MQDWCPTYLTTRKGVLMLPTRKGRIRSKGREGVIIKFWSQDWCPTSLTTSGVDAAN
jgi:hypothetical protein